MEPVSVQLLHVAAHLDAISRTIQPLLASGHIVLLDRYWWSTWVYGLETGVDPEMLRAMIEMERRHWGGVEPDGIFLIQRTDSTGTEPVTGLKRRAAYADLAQQEEGRSSVLRVNNNGSVDAAAGDVLGHVRRRLRAGHGAPPRRSAEAVS